MKEFFPEGFLNESGKAESLNMSALEKAQKEHRILEATVKLCDFEHNLYVDLGGVKGIIPRHEGAIGISDGLVKDIALISRVGKKVKFTVTDIKTDEKGVPLAILSRKEAQEKFRDEFLINLESGDVIDAKVTHIEPFGAFCDIGCGTVALLPIDAISVSRILSPHDRFFEGQNIKAIIKSIDPDGKITLSHKELLGTFCENADLFSVGQTVTGKVRSIEDYGIFVELTPNLAGLAEPKEGVFAGQTASVYIKSIIKEKMKVKLIIIDSFDSDYSLELKYFYKDNKIKRFVYSPECCEKTVVTEF